ncbi:MAG: transcriptional regulator [Flavobacteriales bacterium]|nr:transcriptional regulator [Flavobacteriales bacterium]NQX98852.1 transcriptional regulator [Flavobacteriales bacterium]
MKLDEAKDKFIQQWGSLGSNWGINRTMAQIHALFLITEELLSAEDVMETLKISRGNANMNIRTLIDWGLVYKEYQSGERKEFFRGEKDIWKVTQRVMRTRQRQELDPMINVLAQLQTVESDKKNKKEVEAFTKQIKSIKSFADLADRSLTKISGSEENWFLKTFMRFMK